MNEDPQFVGVATGIDQQEGALRRALFLFDRLALVNLSSARLELRQSPNLVADLGWLEDYGYAVDLKDPTPEWRSRSRGLFSPPFQDIGRLQSGIVEFIEYLKAQRVSLRWNSSLDTLRRGARIAALDEIENRLIARIYTVDLASRSNTDAVLLQRHDASGALGISPLGDFARLTLDRLPEHLRSVAALLSDTREETTAAITLHAFPVPDASTPLFEITAFRKDGESRALFASLKTWMNKVARGDLPPAHIEDELRHLTSAFERHMQLAQMQFERSTITLVAVAAAEFLEELVRFRFSKAFSALGTFQQQHVLLLQAEQVAPGRELAYLVRAHKRFARAG